MCKEDKSKLDFRKYSTQETRLEVIFRVIAVLAIILFPLILVISFRVLTKDSVTVTVDAVVYFHIESPLACLLNIQNNKYATELITVASIRNILGAHSLYNLLTSRESISFKCRTEIDKTTVRWGVVIERVEIKDVLLPFELQRAMAAEAEGTRVAKAKVIESEGEIKAAENLKEASLVMIENPNVMLVRYLQTLNHIASNQSTTVIFPFPIELPGAHMYSEKAVKVVPKDGGEA